MSRLKKKEEGGKFELKFYSGYKGEETPRAVIIGNKEFNIEEVLSRKRICDKKSGEKSEIFKCKMKGEIVKITVFESGKWEILFSEDK